MNRFVLFLLTGGLLMLSVPGLAGAEPLRLTPPPGSVSFGTELRVLANGNIVVTDPDYTLPGPEPVKGAGAVHLFNGATLERISTLSGSQPGDHAGRGRILELPDGNYLVTHYGWRQYTGAVTWCSGTGGVDGQVSAVNSLIGGRPGDLAGIRETEILADGGYAVRSPDWNEGRGAVTWSRGVPGVTGEISAANSLIGSKAGDSVGSSYIRRLTNGNLLVPSPMWRSRSGALTWVDARSPITGEVSAANSLVGMRLDLGYDPLGLLRLLKNGNYVVQTPEWNWGQGAVTWGSGTRGVTGEVSAANSLVGAGSRSVGANWRGIIELASGNFLVPSPDWNAKRGAVTWVDGAKGVSGPVSAANSLVNAGPYAGRLEVYPLANGHYVAAFPDWGSSGLDGARGAVVWGSGLEGVRGEVSAANALTGTRRHEGIGSGGVTVLSNGHYVVNSPGWNENRGAATWCDGGKPTPGEITAANSLIGGARFQGVGTGSLALPNGDYVVRSPYWNQGEGAVTWCDGATGRTGEVSEANSLTGNPGSTGVPGDQVGLSDSVSLGNGHYLVVSGGRGAVTWCRGGAPVTGKVTEANSLVGNDDWKAIGSLGIVVLANGDYVVKSPRWRADRVGAFTWGAGGHGVAGGISAANSLLTSGPDDLSGYGDRYAPQHGLKSLPGGGYSVRLPGWNDRRGAVALGSATEGARGEISSANALTGTRPGDLVGNGGLVELGNGAVVAVSWSWNEGRGAVTWAGSATGLRGEVSASNSLVGTRPGDRVGMMDDTSVTPAGITEIPANGNYLVSSRSWNGGVGAVTWCPGAAGLTGGITSANSLLGTPTFPMSMLHIWPNENGDYIGMGSDGRLSSGWTEARELFVLGDGAMGTVGYPTSGNSLMGSLNPMRLRPSTSWDRKRGRWIISCGYDNLVLLFSPVRSIRVTGGRGADVRDESIPAWRRATDFGPVAVDGGSRAHTFDVVDAGTRRLVLTGDTPVRVTGPDAADFTVTRQPSWLSAEAAHPTFDIVFNPSGPGPRAASVSIDSNADGQGTLTFPIRGAGTVSAREVFEEWRAARFGGAAEGAAPEEDFEGDGVSNLLEFAFDTDPADGAGTGGRLPLGYTGPLTVPEGGGGEGVLTAHGIPLLVVRAAEGAGQEQDSGPRATLVWLRRRDTAGAGLKYTPQFSADLQTWRNAAADPVVLAADGTVEAVAMPFPADVGGADGDGERRFFRLSVTLEP